MSFGALFRPFGIFLRVDGALCVTAWRALSVLAPLPSGSKGWGVVSGRIPLRRAVAVMDVRGAHRLRRRRLCAVLHKHLHHRITECLVVLCQSTR